MADMEAIAASLNTLLTTYGVTRDQIADLLGGAADGGPKGDGSYPVTLASGVTVFVPSPRRLALLSGDVSTAAAVMQPILNAANAAAAQVQKVRDEVLSITKGPQGNPGGDAGQVGSFVVAKTLSYSAGIRRMRTTGRLVDGDGGGAAYDRWTGGTLPAMGRDVWWFTSTADNSAWVLAYNQYYVAAMFGATGGDPRVANSSGVDARAILNAALAAPMVYELNLSALAHFVSVPPSAEDAIINMPSGKTLAGLSRKDSSIIVMAAAIGTRNRPVQAIQFVDDTSGCARDFTLECSRSGLGAGSTDKDRVSGVTIRSKSGDCFGTRVERVDVNNATGYSFYISADYGGNSITRKARGIVMLHCRARNCGVGFEPTGDVDCDILFPYVDCSEATFDGGAYIKCEAMYHAYGPISRVRFFKPVGKGKAGAAFLFIATDPFALKKVIVDEPEVTLTNTTPALVVKGQTFNGTLYRVEDFQLNGGSIICTNAGGGNIENATARIVGTTFVGGQNAATGAGDGAGLDLTTGSIVKLDGVSATGNTNPSGGSAASGLNVQGNAVVELHGGGNYTAIGPAGLMNAITGTVREINPVARTPQPAGSSAVPVDKADYSAAYVDARKNSEPNVPRYVPLTEFATKDVNNRFILGLAQATGVTFGTALCPVNVLGSGRSFLVANSNGNNYFEMGGQGSGTAYFRAYEGNMQVGNAFAGNLHLCTNATNRWTVGAAGHFSPATDNVFDLGTSALRIRNIYASTSAINTSDERDKTWRGGLTDTEMAAAKAMVGELGFYQWNEAIADKGVDGARIHFGARAQRVWTIMADHGLVEPIGPDGRPGRTRYAFLCYDEWLDQYEDILVQPFGPPKQDGAMEYIKTGERLTLAAGNRFGLRLDQLGLFILAAVAEAAWR